MSKFCLTVVAVVLLLMTLPLSNLLIKRTYPAPDDGTEFKAVSDIMVKKCADCHTNDLAVHPLYFGFPIADAIIHRNITNGQHSFLLDRDKLSGKVPFTALDIQKLSSAMAKNNMPPAQYLSLHWDAALSETEQRRLVTWIKKRAKIFDLRAIPAENFLKPDQRKAALGEKLFADKTLSSDGSVSCASCHALDKGGSDQLKVSVGVGGKAGTLNAPTVFNAAYSIGQFWNGRAKNLRAQVDFAVSDPNELASNWQQVIESIRKNNNYIAEFKELYPDGVTARSVSDVIGSYEETLLTPGSRFDKFLAGDANALNADEKAGFEVFKKHECYDCHSGPALGGLSYELMGYSKDYFATKSNLTKEDDGRANISYSKNDLHRFKVPTLRNVALTYPYLHDGSAATLDDVVKIMSDYQVEKPLNAEERKQVVAFLRSLTGSLNGHPLDHTAFR